MSLVLDIWVWVRMYMVGLVNNLKFSGFKDIMLIFILNLIQKEIKTERGPK